MAFTARGLRLVKALEKYSKDKPMFFDTKNIFSKITFTSATDQHLKATMTVDSSMCNGNNSIHGGFIASLIDVMCLYAGVCKTGGRMALTTNLYINYIGPVQEGENVIAVAKTLKDGKSPIMETVLYKEDGNIVAKGTAVFRSTNAQLQTLSSNNLGFDILKPEE